MPKLHRPCRMGQGRPAALAARASMWRGFQSPEATRYRAACMTESLGVSTSRSMHIGADRHKAHEETTRTQMKVTRRWGRNRAWVSTAIDINSD
eukprot:1157596-Pelagomonas_calceolata.AAC.10